MYVKVREMKIGEISSPFKTTDENNNEVFRIVKLDNILSAHSANLKDDYQNLYDAALVKERAKVFDKWVKQKIGITYIKISEEFKGCDFLQKGWLK
jgi:peptidyl-prolyl cis-trans isomerase SurA